MICRLFLLLLPLFVEHIIGLNKASNTVVGEDAVADITLNSLILILDMMEDMTVEMRAKVSKGNWQLSYNEIMQGKRASPPGYQPMKGAQTIPQADRSILCHF